MFLRLARPAHTDTEKRRSLPLKALNFGDETYGRQLQDRAVPGLAAEGQMAVTYQPKTVSLSGGETEVLQVPAYRIDKLSYGPLGCRHHSVAASPIR